MPSRPSANVATAVEATVTSKGQVTLPKAIRTRLGIEAGSRIRFSLMPDGTVRTDKVLHDLEDSWARMDDLTKKSRKSKRAMTFEEMNEAKARRVW